METTPIPPSWQPPSWQAVALGSPPNEGARECPEWVARAPPRRQHRPARCATPLLAASPGRPGGWPANENLRTGLSKAWGVGGQGGQGLEAGIG